MRRTSRILVFVVISLLWGAAARAADAELDWPDLSQQPPPVRAATADAALIVAIERYAELPAVPGARKNAEDWQAWLTKTRGLAPDRVFLLRDQEATVEKIRKHARRAADAAQAGGTVWIVFIGHGSPAPDGADGLLVGYDAQQDVESLGARSLPQRELLAIARAGAQKPQVVSVIDACFSGRGRDGQPLVKGLQPLVVVRAGLPKEALARAVVLTAAKSNQFAGPLPGAERPAFSYLVLGGLRGWADLDSDGKVSAREPRDYAARALASTVRDRSQEPELHAASPDLTLASAVEKGPELAALQRGRAPKSAPAATASSGGREGPLTVAVAAFRVSGLPPDLDWMGKSFADALLGRLAKGRGVRVVEREFLEQIAAELKLQSSSMVDERSAVKMGRVLGARVFVFGSVAAFEDQLVVRARAVSVERAEVLETAESIGDKKALFALQRDLAQKLTAALTVDAAVAQGGTPAAEIALSTHADLERLRELARGLPLYGLDPARRRKSADYQLALSIVDRVLAAAPQLAAAHAYRALFSLHAERFADARAALATAVRLGGRDVDVALLSANLAVAENRFPEALAALAEGSRTAPEDARVWYLLGRVHAAENRLVEAGTSYLAAAERQPAIRELDTNLQSLFGGPGGPALAAEIAARQPQFGAAATLYAALYQRDFATAERAAAALGPSPALYTAHYARGMAAKGRGDRLRAISDFSMALALRPGAPEVHRELALATAQTGQCEVGRAHAVLYLKSAQYIPDYEQIESALRDCR